MVHFAELFRQSVTVPPLSFRSLAARLSPPAGGWGLPAFAVRLKQSGITALEQFHQQLTFEGPTRLRTLLLHLLLVTTEELSLHLLIVLRFHRS